MSLPTLPNEIFHQISTCLSHQDRKECMCVCQSWLDRFQPTVMQCIYISSRHQLKQFIAKLAETTNSSRPLGLLVRRLALLSHVGMSNKEFHLLPIYCPYLEYIDFNPALWRYFAYTAHIGQWRYLAQFPCMGRLRLTLPILQDTGSSITHLEMSNVMVDELADTNMTIISLLKYTPNLISLKLSNGIMTSQNISISEFESIHTFCPHIETLRLDSFDSHLMTKDGYLVDIETLPTASQLKNLRLNMSINSEDFLHYWAHKYPFIQTLDIQLRLLEPEYYHEAVQPENSRMKESFAVMATSFRHLKRLKARFDEKYFPCDVFLNGINSIPTQMEQVSIHFFNFDYHRRSARNFKLLMSNSINTMTDINISNWDRSWDYELDILEPLSRCSHLRNLSLSPQPGTLTEFDIDIILDRCIHLERLELSNTYNLFVRDDANDNIVKIHRLEAITLMHTMVNNRLFEYLALRCPFLNTLDISHVIKPYDNNIQVTINMPYHRFKSIHIEKLQLGLRIEDSGFQCNHYATILSLEETEKTEKQLERQRRALENHKHVAATTRYPERWYHLYQSQRRCKGHNNESMLMDKLQPRVQRLDESDIDKIKGLHVTKQLWEQISFVGSRIKYEDKNNWHLDIPFGHFSVRCRSVNEIRFEQIAL
ncbi:uncharacterized protein ATC70_003303 [Mucor velutinosus]|uniref:F-box domain-containing protein n=1 Tax=Mucor velutinosus TaxID=708070 RepID=A0AAN7HRU1_9FUNG|nr:hypothetical protein ATC70_003303 [Mucor velutinosus]